MLCGQLVAPGRWLQAGLTSLEVGRREPMTHLRRYRRALLRRLTLPRSDRRSRAIASAVLVKLHQGNGTETPVASTSPSSRINTLASMPHHRRHTMTSRGPSAFRKESDAQQRRGTGIPIDMGLVQFRNRKSAVHRPFGDPLHASQFCSARPANDPFATFSPHLQRYC